LRTTHIDSLTIREYLGGLHKRNKKVTIARKLSALRSFFRYLIKQGIIRDDPSRMILTPKQENPGRRKRFPRICLWMICSDCLTRSRPTPCWV
jgi:site-specific recombinase XerD